MQPQLTRNQERNCITHGKVIRTMVGRRTCASIHDVHCGQLAYGEHSGKMDMANTHLDNHSCQPLFWKTGRDWAQDAFQAEATIESLPWMANNFFHVFVATKMVHFFKSRKAESDFRKPDGQDETITRPAFGPDRHRPQGWPWTHPLRRSLLSP